MNFFSKFKDEGTLSLVFDIGSSSVGGALFYMQKNGVPNIVYSVREPILLEKEIDFDRFLSLTVKSLSVVVDKIYTARLGNPKKVFCVLSSPWYASQIRTMNFKKNTYTILNEEFFDSLIQKEVKIFEQENKIKNKNYFNETRQVEIKNMRVMLDGYYAKEPLGKKAKEIEITLFVSISPENVLTKFEEVIRNHFYSKKIEFSSFSLISFSIIRDVFMYQDNFLLVDIGGEVTDISMVKKDIICDSISFPCGYNSMIRDVSSAVNCSIEEAYSSISLYKDNHMLESFDKKIESIVNKFKKDWLKIFQESLIKLSSNISIPSTIFLTTDNSLAILFSETIKNEQFIQYTFIESKFDVVFLNIEKLHGMAILKDNTMNDSYLVIESIYLNHFLK